MKQTRPRHDAPSVARLSHPHTAGRICRRRRLNRAICKEEVKALLRALRHGREPPRALYRRFRPVAKAAFTGFSRYSTDEPARLAQTAGRLPIMKQGPQEALYLLLAGDLDQGGGRHVWCRCVFSCGAAIWMHLSLRPTAVTRACWSKHPAKQKTTSQSAVEVSPALAGISNTPIHSVHGRLLLHEYILETNLCIDLYKLMYPLQEVLHDPPPVVNCGPVK